MRILIVEDNADIAGHMTDFLQSRGHVIDFTATGDLALRLLKNAEYDVIVLDLMLPDTDGITLCKKIRLDPGKGQIPVLMLTARDTLEDKLLGFEAGTDDYLVKPFSLLELEARLNALNYRRSAHGQARTLSFSDIVYDLDALEIFRGERRISLPGAARTILEALLRANGHIVSRSELSQALWGDEPPDADALSVHMHSLRAALHGPGEPPILGTVRGEGYRLVDEQ